MSNESKKKITVYLTQSTIKAMHDKARKADVMHGALSDITESALRQFLGLD